MAKKSSTKRFSSSFVPLIVADVFQLAGSFRRWGDRIASDSGQTQARWQILSAASAEDVSVAQIARRLGVARQGVQRVADLLVDDSLAKYAENPRNARSPHLRLSQQGERLLQKLTAAADRYHHELAEGFSAEELETAAVVLRKLCLQLDRDLAGK